MKTKGNQDSNIEASTMSSPTFLLSQRKTSDQNNVLADEHLTLTANRANTSRDAPALPAAPPTANTFDTFQDSADDHTISTFPPTAPASFGGGKDARAKQNTLYNVICCPCGRILNLQNVHYAFYCVNCKHKRCDSCTMKAI